MIKKIKSKWNKIKWSIMKFFHINYIKTVKIPIYLRYTIAVILIISGIALLTTPIPWILFIFMGIWIISPTLQYKYIWKYFKSDNFKNIEDNIAMNIEQILNAEQKWYYKYKSKLKQILKNFK